MSGHSKWATTKRHKAAVDAKRGKIFSILGKEITLAARAGGGDMESNARLRTVVDKAKGVNMPNENIKKAIQKGTGELQGGEIDELVYEGYAPGGVGIIVEVTTDNKNRSVGEVRSTITKNGGTFASPGALMFNFKRCGQFVIEMSKISEDVLMEIALEAGADDVTNDGEFFEVLCPVNEYDKVARALSDKNIIADSSELAYLPLSTVKITNKEEALRILRIIERLDDLDDVKNVFANYELDDSLDLDEE